MWSGLSGTVYTGEGGVPIADTDDEHVRGFRREMYVNKIILNILHFHLSQWRSARGRRRLALRAAHRHSHAAVAGGELQSAGGGARVFQDKNSF